MENVSNLVDNLFNVAGKTHVAKVKIKLQKVLVLQDTNEILRITAMLFECCLPKISLIT